MSSSSPPGSPEPSDSFTMFQTRNRMDLRISPTSAMTVLLFLAPEHTRWFTQVHLQQFISMIQEQLPALFQDEREGMRPGMARIWRGDEFVSTFCMVPSKSTCRVSIQRRPETNGRNYPSDTLTDGPALLKTLPKEFHALVEPIGHSHRVPLMPGWQLAYPKGNTPAPNLRQASLI
ncbi:hypothetical protein BJ684DRAFT_18194 [Piptocephalis cylindrospora]|uniref:Uncharacterized protein n=1 Tax=Piptocephalis cylindrospora TaxID=1907219 RepID=A0A4P9YAG4_9FUNG|nr:hypothetical protein BJ684DRAFT_18194 [Piptocephalis cylindrospora]|eukprot:RKP15491.1 hypothetical protein BJ684DRAFT_18194 [Piptocephalis cylindrospora]